MAITTRVLCSVMMIIGLASSATAAVSEISNFQEYSEQFASSGQPTKRQLQDLKDAGFERIIYIAFTSSGKAYDDEDEQVKELGMDYVQIPVDWENPTRSDFYAFAGVMQTGATQKTLLHCQVNFRASAFSFLYRVVYGGVPVAEAKADMNTVWEPNETWVKLIFDVLEENDISPNCDGCDWTSEMQH